MKTTLSITWSFLLLKSEYGKKILSSLIIVCDGRLFHVISIQILGNAKFMWQATSQKFELAYLEVNLR